MAVLTTVEKNLLKRSNWLFRKLDIAGRLSALGTDGTIASVVGAAVAGTTNDSFTLASGESDGTFVISVNTTGSNHAYTLKIPVTTQAVTMLLPDVASDTLVSLTATQTLSAKTLTTPTISATGWTNAQHSHTAANSGGAIAAQSASTGTTSNTFDVDSDSVTGILRVQSTVGGTNHTITLTNATTTAARTVTLPDLTGTVALLTGAQTFASKTLTAPVINAATITGTVTISGTPTISGTWTDLGAVTTVDINGGTVDGTNIGATTPGTGAFSTLSATGASTLGDDATLAAGKDLILTKGTGEIKINANTSGSLIILPTAATAQAVTLATAAQTSGAATVSIPDMAGVSTTFVLAGAANTFTGLQIIDMDDEVDGIEDLLTLKHTSSNNQATVADGIGISFVLENATGTALEEEWASIDVLSTTITNGSEDGDIQISQMLGGVVTPSLLLDASAQEVAIGQSSADADGMNALRIYPHTTASRGSLVLTSAINGSGNFVTTVTQATDVSESQTITIADADGATDTFSMLATAESFSAVKTFTAAPVVTITDAGTTTVTDVATFTHLGGTPDVGLGLGLSFIVENDTDGTTQCASLDIINTTVAKGTMDTDILFSTMLAGTVREVLRVDASAQELIVGVSEAVGDQINTIRINPHTTASRGALLLTSAINGTGNFTTTVTQATDVSESQTITIADAAGATDTFSMLATAETFSGVKTFSAAPLITVDDATDDAVVDVLTLTHSTSAGTFGAANIGTGISIQTEDGAGNVAEVASIDVSLSTATSGSEDADFVFSAVQNGTVRECIRFDSSDQSLSIGLDNADADDYDKLRIFPVNSTNGAFVLQAIAQTGDTDVTMKPVAMGQATAIEIPDPGAATGTFALIDMAQTFAGAQTFSAEPVISINDASNTSVTDLLQLTHTSSAGPGAGMGAGISVIIENDTDSTTENSCIDFVTTNDGTKATLDTDVIIKTMLGGALQSALMVDASAQEVVIGQDVTDTDGVSALRIWPRTAIKGSLLILASDNAGDDTVTITNNASTSADVTITLPVATSTLSTLGLANIMSAVNTYGLADAATNTTVFPVVLNHTSSSTEAALFGVGVDFQLSDASNNVQSAGTIGTEWAVATHGSEDADMVFSVAISDGTVTEMMRLDSITSSLMLGPATGGSLCTDLIIHPTTTANGSLVLHAANNASADVKTIIQNGQSGAESTFTLPTAASGTVALTAQASGAINRSDITQDDAAVYRIPLMTMRTNTGLVLDASGGANLFKIDVGGAGSGTVVLTGETANNNTKTDYLMFEFAVPPEYVASETITVGVDIIADDSGAPTFGTATLQIEAFEVADAGTAGSDLASGGAQDLTGSDAYQRITSTITDAGIGAGDKLCIILTCIIAESASQNGNAVIGNVEVALDIKG